MNTFSKLLIALSLAGLACMPGISNAATTTANNTNAVQTAKKVEVGHYLFILRAKTGVVTKSGDGYTITLKGMNNNVLYFSDRPVRYAGYSLTSRFLTD